MFYISSKKNNTYGVTDTSDGIEEFYTIEQLKELILRGFRIKGCSYRDREDLKKNGFWNVEVQEKRNKVSIKVGRYYNFKFRDRWDGINQCTGYCSKIDSSEYDFVYFILMDGNSIRVAYDNIIDFKETRTINKDLRDLVSMRLQISQAIEQKTNQIDILKQEIYKLNEQLKNMSAKFLAAQGQITWNDFVNIALNSMSENLKSNLQFSGYKIDSPCVVGLEENIIYFTRTTYICNGRDVDFVYLEYDGTFHMRGDAENSKSYKSYLKQYRKVICTDLPYEENIILCEYKVMHQGWYKVVVPNEPLTKELAVRLGKSLK